MSHFGNLGMPRMNGRNMRPLVLLLWIMCVSMFTLFIPATARAESAAVGLAKNAKGTLVVVRVDGTEERLRGKGALALFEGDVLRTDNNSGALIELSNEIQVGLNRNTSFKIVSRGEKEKGITRILRLKQGMLWVKASGGPNKLEVETPVAIAVVKGTEFIIEALKNGHSVLTVIEGLVEFGTAFGTCPIRTSTVSYAEQGKKCTKAVTADIKSATNWTAELRGTEATAAAAPPAESFGSGFGLFGMAKKSQQGQKKSEASPPVSKNGGDKSGASKSGGGPLGGFGGVGGIGAITGSGAEAPAAALPIFWPPPDASTHQKIPRELLVPNNTRVQTWASVAARLEKALADNGYSSPGYYAVPEGFALISQLERINADATPSPPNVRWKIKVDPVSIVPFNLEAYLKALLGKDAGLFRVIAFVFTPVPIITSGQKTDIEEAKLWVGKGGSKLPQILSKQVYGEDMEATALIYEFEIPGHGKAARLNKPSEHNGQQHLKAARILQALGG